MLRKSRKNTNFEQKLTNLQTFGAETEEKLNSMEMNCFLGSKKRRKSLENVKFGEVEEERRDFIWEFESQRE